MSGARTRLYPQAVASIAGDLAQGAARRAAEITASRARQNVMSAQRVDTGRMARGIKATPSRTNGLRARWQVRATEPYSKYQEFGTRAHGPVRASRLVFRPKGGGRTVFAKWVRGVTPARFMRKALDRLRTSDYL